MRDKAKIYFRSGIASSCSRLSVTGGTGQIRFPLWTLLVTFRSRDGKMTIRQEMPAFFRYLRVPSRVVPGNSIGAALFISNCVPLPGAPGVSFSVFFLL